MNGRLMRLGLVCAFALALVLGSANAALAIPPYVNCSVSAPGNTAPSGWYNVPITLMFTDISWDDPLFGGRYGIADVSYSRSGGSEVAVVPTSTLSLSEDGTYTVRCQGSWGGYAYPIMLGIDRTTPASWLSMTSTAGVPCVSLTASDTCSGPAHIAYALDSDPDVTRTVSAAQPSVFVTATPGDHEIWWAATDLANNAESPWHHASFTIAAPAACALGRPSVRVHRGLVWFSGRITPQRQSTSVRLVIERRSGRAWRHAATARVTVPKRAGTWVLRRVRLPRGWYRVTAIAASGTKSPTAYFRR